MELCKCFIISYKGSLHYNGVIRPGIVHRLDKDTSGVIVVAKNDEAHSTLSDMFKEKTLEKVYIL